MAEQLTSCQQTAARTRPFAPISTKVEQIPSQIANPFVNKHHYAGKAGAGKNISFGLYLNDDELYAVAQYGVGVQMNSPDKFLGRLTGLGPRITKNNLLELKRLA